MLASLSLGQDCMVFTSFCVTSQVFMFHLYYYHYISKPFPVKNDFTEPNLH